MPTSTPISSELSLDSCVPEELRGIDDLQTAIPAIAKDASKLALIREAVGQIPTRHLVRLVDARHVDVQPESVHLVVTSPPY
jgi:hypothetical protein